MEYLGVKTEEKFWDELKLVTIQYLKMLIE